MALKQHTNIKATPLRGGAITVREPALLPVGSFTAAQNVRPKRPGFIKRKGTTKFNPSADGTNNVETLHQFKKGRVTEGTHFFAQMSDGDILETSTNIPSTSATLSEVWSGNSNPLPATWAENSDLLFVATGRDMPQVYAGTQSFVHKFVKFMGSAAPPDIPESGFDYSHDVQNESATTYADLSSLDTYANNDCFYIMTPVPTQSINIAITAPNGNTSTLSVYYRKNDSTWAAVSGLSDGTASGGATLAQTGDITWTAPSDEIDHYQYGVDGYWYQFRVSAALDSGVTAHIARFEAGFQDSSNLWDGVPVDAVECMVENDDTGYETYGSGSVSLDELTSGNKIYIAAVDPIEGLYIDVGATPNTTAATEVTSLKYWDGDSWASVGTDTDGTNGLRNSGWITFPRQSAVQPLHFESTQYYAYWYELIWSTAISADVVISIQTRPYFDMSDFGTTGYSVRTYHDRMSYAFNEYGEYLYISAAALPQVLNGDDYGIIEMGDGRSNKIRACANFYNNMLVWQEEKGVEGGCTTLLQGYDPTTYGKLVLSSRIGIMNGKSYAVVEDVATSAEEPEKVKTIAFWISRYGVIACDGRSLSVISDDIQDYFDPNESNCLRRGYEDNHWLQYDSLYNVLRLGLVTGSGTECNAFPVFDLTDKVWYFDDYNSSALTPTCMVEAEGSSGNYIVYQMLGDTNGTIWRSNTGTVDGSNAIDTYIDIVFPYGGLKMLLNELMLQCEVQSAGNISMNIYDNENSRATKTLAMTAERTNELVRTHRFNLNVISRLLKIGLQHNTASQDINLETMGVSLLEWEGA